MLCWMTILGGALIMMGQHDRSEALFYYFRLEDQVPESHLLRQIEKHISLAFVREKLKESYSECMSRIRSRLRIPIRPTRPKVEPRPGWVTTITIWSITRVV